MKVFLSYSSKDELFTEKLDSKLMQFGVNIFRDKRELQPLQNIKEFMIDISKMDYAIMLISRNYLKSEPCVFEFTEYLKKENAHQTIIPIIVTDFNFSNSVREDILDHIHEENSTKFKKKSWFKKAITKFIGNKENASDWNKRFDTTWHFLKNTKIFNYKESQIINFSDILNFLKIYDDDIQNSLDKIEKIEDIEERDIQYDELLEQHPGSIWIIRYRAYLCTKEKQYTRAIHLFKKFILQFSDPMDMILAYYDLGVCYTKLKDYENALEAHQEAININPFAYMSHRGLGDVYMEQNEFDKAYKSYEFSNKFQKNCLVLNNMASILYSQGNSSKAIELYKEAIELNEEESISYKNLAITYKKKNDFLNYDEILEISFQKFPDDYMIITEYAMCNIVKERGDPLTNLNLLKKSFSINPNYIETRLFLGYWMTLYYNGKSNQNEKLDFAKKMLLETLEMNITEEEQKAVQVYLKLISLVLKQNKDG